METADQFTFGLGQVERCTVGLTDHRHAVDQERRQQQEDVPDAFLRLDDAGGGHGAAEQEHRRETQRHRDLVGDHLRRRAQPAEQRIGRTRRPARQHDPVHTDRGDGQDVEYRHRQIGELQCGPVAQDGDLRPDRDDRERHERGYHRNDRRQNENRLVDNRRDDIFLQRHLHAVGDGLQRALGADPVRADAHLHPGHDLAFQIHRHHRREQQKGEDRQGFPDDEPQRVVAETGGSVRPGGGSLRNHGGPSGRRSEHREITHGGVPSSSRRRGAAAPHRPAGWRAVR